MKKILCMMIACCPLFGMHNKGTKRKREENSAQEAAKNEQSTIEQLRRTHQSLSDALLCVARPYHGETDEEISQTVRLIIQQPDVDIHTTDLAGQSALTRAAYYNLPKTMHVLLLAGARIQDLRNLQVMSIGHKNTIENMLTQYKKEPKENLTEAKKVLAKYLPVTYRQGKTIKYPLVDLTLGYLRWAEDYATTIPKSLSLKPKQLKF